MENNYNKFILGKLYLNKGIKIFKMKLLIIKLENFIQSKELSNIQMKMKMSWKLQSYQWENGQEIIKNFWNL